MKIEEMHSSERPREKMAAAGPGALSNGELLAILLRSGNRGESALELAQRILSKSDGKLSALLEKGGLSGIKGLGPCKAMQIGAALELGRRFMEESVPSDRLPVTTARMVYDIMLPEMKGLHREECWVLFLSAASYLKRKVKLSSGTSDATGFEIKEILRLALEERAASIIIVHNHPGCNPHPSNADISLTEKLNKASATFGIALLDHVIVSDGCFFSFSEERARRV